MHTGTKKGFHYETPYLLSGTGGEIRTPDQLVRSQLLYPAELHPHFLSYLLFHIAHHLPDQLARGQRLYPAELILRYGEANINN
jgi:hypothetical protein